MSARRMREAFGQARQRHEDSGSEESDFDLDGHASQAGSQDSGLEDPLAPRVGRAIPGSVIRSKLFGDLDLDRNGAISREEWLAAFDRIADKRRGADGVVSRKEWALLGGQNCVFDAITDKRRFAVMGRNDWRKAFDRLDRDRDGSITLEEWLALANGPDSAMYVGHNYAFQRDVKRVSALGSPRASVSRRASQGERPLLANVTGIVANPAARKEPPDWRTKNVDVDKALAQLASLEGIMKQHKWQLDEIEGEGTRREAQFKDEIQRLTEECAHSGAVQARAQAEEANTDRAITTARSQLQDLLMRKQRAEHMLRASHRTSIDGEERPKHLLVREERADSIPFEDLMFGEQRPEHMSASSSQDWCY